MTTSQTKAVKDGNMIQCIRPCYILNVFGSAGYKCDEDILCELPSKLATKSSNANWSKLTSNMKGVSNMFCSTSDGAHDPPEAGVVYAVGVGNDGVIRAPIGMEPCTVW